MRGGLRSRPRASPAAVGAQARHAAAAAPSPLARSPAPQRARGAAHVRRDSGTLSRRTPPEGPLQTVKSRSGIGGWRRDRPRRAPAVAPDGTGSTKSRPQDAVPPTLHPKPTSVSKEMPDSVASVIRQQQTIQFCCRYPGPRPKPKPRPKRTEARSGEGRGRRRKRVFRRPVPNSRLYRPAPARPPPPPAWPRAIWPPPTPTARLETASRVALRLSEQRRGTHARPRSPIAHAARPAPARAVHSSPARALRSSPARALRSSPARAVRSSTARARRTSPVRAGRSPGRQARAPRPRSPQPAPLASAEPPSQRLVVTLPAAPAVSATRYRPASEHFRLRSLDTDSGASSFAVGRPAARAPLPTAAPAMAAGNRHSTSPEDCSDGNETLSAPSEFLAEFLSAIMRRQYAEALKYCRLILQYEPHNATARGFYPLLQHKVQQAHQRAEDGAWARGSSSEDASAHSDKPPPQHQHQHQHKQELMEQGADESEGSASEARSWSRGSCASQSSLELDSSDALAHSSASLSVSRRTEHTDSASGGCWESTGSASRSEPDDNGNAPPPPRSAGTLPPRAADLHTDNAAAAGEPPRAVHKSDSTASLRRLRAQFTCSIK